MGRFYSTKDYGSTALDQDAALLGKTMQRKIHPALAGFSLWCENDSTEAQ